MIQCEKRSRSPTRGVTIESAVSCLTIRRQYSSQIVTQTLSVKLDQHRANQSKLVSQLRLIHHHSPSQCICLSFSYSVEHSQLCVTVCLCFTRTHTRALMQPSPSYSILPPNSQKLCWGGWTQMKHWFCLFMLQLHKRDLYCQIRRHSLC